MAPNSSNGAILLLKCYEVDHNLGCKDHHKEVQILVFLVVQWYVEMTGAQMPQNVKSSRDTILRREAEENVRKEDNYGKRKIGRSLVSNSKKAIKKDKKWQNELGDSEGKEVVPIK